MLVLNKSAVEDSTSMRVITFVTLVYLPSTFVAVSERSWSSYLQCYSQFHPTEHRTDVLRDGIFCVARRFRSVLDLFALCLAILRTSNTAHFSDIWILEMESQSCCAVKKDTGPGEVKCVSAVVHIWVACRSVA
jgi:hypothetical protein